MSLKSTSLSVKGARYNQRNGGKTFDLRSFLQLRKIILHIFFLRSVFQMTAESDFLKEYLPLV